VDGAKDLEELCVGEAFFDKEVIFLENDELVAHVFDVFFVVFADTEVFHEGWDVCHLNLTLKRLFVRGFLHIAGVQAFIIVFDCLNENAIDFH